MYIIKKKIFSYQSKYNLGDTSELKGKKKIFNFLGPWKLLKKKSFKGVRRKILLYFPRYFLNPRLKILCTIEESILTLKKT